jgi:DnaJ-class molecular chaperone
VLNVSKGTSCEGIRKAYKDAVRLWHPDKGGRIMEKEALDCIMRHVNGAYEMLEGRVGKRKERDRETEEGQGAKGWGWRGWGW